MTRAAYLRRYAEIEAKRSSLRVELDSWKHITDTVASLRRYNSQIRLLDATLSGMLETVEGAMREAPIESTVLDRGTDWENDILAAHSIWEIFRSKYALRQNELFCDYLAACDDLAWECYAPARARFAAAGLPSRTPPLVYLSSTWSPFVQSRDSNFQNEVRATGVDSAALRREAVRGVLGRLPIPLVSLPWYQAFHLPGAILLAHEMGHVVQHDFDLEGAISAALVRARLQFPEVWVGWAAETFADIYGCLAMGPAFAGALIDLLLASVATVTNEERRGGTHPVRALRVEIVLTVLDRTGYRLDSQRLRESWNATYPAPVKMQDFIADVASIVEVLLEGPYHGSKLTDVISFSAHSGVERIASAAGGGRTGELQMYSDPRALFAAAQRLHEDPVPRQDPEAFQLLVTQIIQKGAGQYRHEGKPVASKEELGRATQAQEQQARELGKELRQSLSTPSEPSKPPAT